jgi:hypothetical protein
MSPHWPSRPRPRCHASDAKGGTHAQNRTHWRHSVRRSRRHRVHKHHRRLAAPDRLATSDQPSPRQFSRSPTALPDEDQIRQTVIAFQDAANTQNWDAYLDLMCAPMRARFTGAVMDYLKKERTEAGVTTVTITSVSIDGDNAKANFDSHNEAIGSASVSLPLKHEGDGWKICQTY